MSKWPSSQVRVGEMNWSSWFWLFDAKLPEREMTGAGEKTTSPSSCVFFQSR